MVLLTALAAVLSTLAGQLIGGCGGDGEQSDTRPVSAVIGLDFTPNAVHAPNSNRS